MSDSLEMLTELYNRTGEEFGAHVHTLIELNSTKGVVAMGPVHVEQYWSTVTKAAKLLGIVEAYKTAGGTVDECARRVHTMAESFVSDNNLRTFLLVYAKRGELVIRPRK